ncbi:hypothetical protein [Prochlorococcus marinus]|uniref:hypothetical protein n=1 Tax=Prochlorococcus marinus TaxID=1219 RepID=UPI0001900C4E|nr:hypothetical protein [Prochlorococcus marinus]EEE40843.1 conserved hypothetical protein [Prochlorococcus marinus str. MIT 9202]
MNILVVYLGSFYIALGTIFLLVPIIYIELGRPKDLFKAFFNFLIGLILIIKNKSIGEFFLLILLLLSVLVVFYLVEISLFRWYQLTDIEKKKITTLSALKKNLSKIVEATNLAFGDFAKFLNFFNFGSNNQNTYSKKWVRNDKNDNIKV